MKEMESTGSAICSICYDDLKPFVSDLQAVSVCGHVFHELCLQQWFECSATRKQTCPVCKQNCSGNKAFRLYFQSTEETVYSDQTQHPNAHGDNSDALYREVRKLEAKVSSLNSTVEHQVKDLKDLNHELNQCKELLQTEIALKDDALKQKSAIQQLLHRKSQELDKSNILALRLQERNMALAKELAALKLVTDLDLAEDEVLKLASLGNDSSSKDTVDILKKSLVIRNKNYKDLMAKCNVLGRGEAIYSRKLERAKEKITKLKIRVQELETAAEAKENEVLRSLRPSNNNNNSCISSSTAKKLCVEDRLGRHPALASVPQTGIFTKSSHFPEMKEAVLRKDTDASENYKPESNVYANKEETSFILIDEDSPLKSCKDNEETMKQDVSTIPIRTSGLKSKLNHCSTTANEDVMILSGSGHGDTDPVLNIRKETPLQPVISTPGNICFSGGLLGPDGTSRYLGKWCKRTQNSNISNGDLITVGSDGRGGRIKALRSPIQSFMNHQENSAKRSKSGSKTSASPSQGCLQIEHFFQKMNR